MKKYEISEETINEVLELLQYVKLGMKTSNNRYAFQVFVELISIINKDKDNGEDVER